MPASDLNVVNIKAAFVTAALYCINSHLISFSIRIIDHSRILARIVIDEEADEDAAETVLSILGNMTGHFSDVYSDFSVVRARFDGVSPDTEMLEIQLFHRAI